MSMPRILLSLLSVLPLLGMLTGLTMLTGAMLTGAARAEAAASPLATAPVAASATASAPQATPQAPRLRMAWEQGEVVVRLLDNAASRSLVAQLPLTLEFTDFGGAEKIATPPQRLQTQDSPTAQQSPGDFTYYAPWGNLAVFYRGKGNDRQLYVLGHIESGKDVLGRMQGAFRARLEVLP